MNKKWLTAAGLVLAALAGADQFALAHAQLLPTWVDTIAVALGSALTPLDSLLTKLAAKVSS